ncbi:sulfotransferase [Roseobacter sp. HKCCA0434]|uniref:sulfotransferase n=1 Tax=Roseobacter sp. HKCCA0434 TaxID=3079297 RepID=UPI0029058316|nr:sulfotransferase [Roseobacter sp. HKCCA0434]
MTSLAKSVLRTVRDTVRGRAARAARARIRARHGSPQVYARKVFCVGRNKTGTTTMERLLRECGFDMGPQREAERLLARHGWTLGPEFWAFVDAHEAFQDVPFSSSWAFPAIFARHPDALYILTRRDPEEWFASIANHHLGLLGLPPDTDRFVVAERMKAHAYIAPGYLYETHIRQFGVTRDEDLYDRDLYISNYERHNALVQETVPAANLLDIDITAQADAGAIARFVGMDDRFDLPMAWENRRR